jgi:hypothetical protein
MAEPEEENKYQNRSLGGEKTGNGVSKLVVVAIFISVFITI